LENKIRELREVRGISQAALAKKLSVSRQTIISIEKGRYDPSLPLAFKIAEAFGLKVDDVFCP